MNNHFLRSTGERFFISLSPVCFGPISFPRLASLFIQIDASRGEQTNTLSSSSSARLVDVKSCLCRHQHDGEALCADNYLSLLKFEQLIDVK